MARFSIISKDGNKIRYEGKPRYIGTYLKPSYLEFSEIASPTPIDWQIGDYIDYPRTGMRYRLYSIPQASKNARKGSHGRAFTYSNVQLHAATKELEIALFKDLVSADNNIHFSTSPDVATFEDVYGIARRIQACMDDLYPNRWIIEVADFNAVEDAEMLENITTAKDFALSGGTCLDALTKIYELWQEVGWIHTYDSASGKNVITIGYANKRIGANTTEAYIYGKGNGLTAIKKTQANKDEFATRLYVYGSDRNLPSRYYNGKYILNAESVDIRNLMIPIGQWKTTGGAPDARKAYIENAEAVAKYGIIPKTHYFDSDDAGADIYPTIEGITIGQVRRLQADYKPSTSIYPNDEERIDEVKSAVNPNDDGVIRPLGKAYKYYKIENVEAEKSDITLTNSTVVKVTKILLLTDLEGEGKVDMTVIPDIGFALDDAGFTEVNATFELTDSPTKTKNISKISSVVAKRNGTTGRWEFKAPRISVDYDYVSTGSIPVSYVLTLEATLSEKREGETIAFDIEQGEIEVGANALLDKEFTIALKQIGFNIEERASVGSGKTISMKTGDNEGRNFVIKECRYEGSSDSWILTCRRQQDNNLGMLFPNKDYQIKQNDRFVLLDIAMPELYVAAAMERLFAEGQKLLSKVSRVQNNYEPSIDAKVMAESGRTIREGMFMQIADEDIIDGATEYILIDTINIYEDEAAIPTYKVTLKEKKKVSYKGTPSATTTSNTSSVEEKTDIDLSGYVTKEKFAAIEFLKDLFYKYDDTTYGTKYNLFSEGEMSANGLNLGGGTSGGGGLIQNVLGKSSFGTVASEDNATTFNAYAIDSLYKRIVELEGKDVEVDLSDYYTKQQTQNAITSALSPYIKATDADGKYAALASFNALQSSFDRLYSALNDDTSGVINTWNEVVDFVNEYSGSEDLSTILGRMNTDINARVKVSDFDTWKTDVFNPLSVAVTNLGNKVDTNTANINKLLGWFNVDADGNLFTTYNFYSTKEISANGISQGTGGGGSGLISSVLGVGSLGATLANDNSVVFNAYATNEIYKATQGHASRIGVLESQVGQLTTQSTKVSVSDLLTTGTKIATITVDGVPHEVKGDFLPTSGGTINGTTSLPLTIAGNSTSYVGLGFKRGSNADAYIVYYGGRNWAVTSEGWAEGWAMLHAGNYSSYALPLTGGTLSGNLTINNTLVDVLTLHRKDANNAPSVKFTNKTDGTLGYIGIAGSSTSFGINPFFMDKEANAYPLIHSGNVGDYALKIDGSNYMKGPLVLQDTTDISIVNNMGIFVGRSNKVGGAAFDYASFINIPDRGISQLQLSWHRAYNNLKLVTRIYESNTWSDWKTIAFTDSNVASAQALANNNGNVALYVSNGHILYDSNGREIIDYGDDWQCFGAWTGLSTAIRGSQIKMEINGNPKMLINSSGNVTLGDSDLAGAYTKLRVDGTICGGSLGTSAIYFNNGSKGLCVTGTGIAGWMAEFGNGQNGVLIGCRGESQDVAAIGTIGAKSLLLNPDGGNVLIGTTTDSGYKLDVNGNARILDNVIIGKSSSENGRLKIVGEDNSASTSALYISNWDGNTLLDVKNNGNVGIGTNAPQCKLDVNGDIKSATVRAAQIELSYTTPFIDFHFNNSTADYTSRIIEQKSGMLTINEALHVKYNGRVGIGTIDPKAKLGVKGDILAIGANESLGGIAFRWGLDGQYCVGSNTTEDFYLWTDIATDLRLGVSGTERMRVKANGNVGIGIAGPEYKLDVAGTLRATDAVTFGSTLTVAGATTHNGIAYFGSTTYYINTSGNANFNAISGRSLQVDSAAFNGTIHSNEYSGNVAKWSITKDGAASFASLSNGGLLETSTLRVSSTSTFTRKTNHNGGIGAAWVSISGTLEVGTTSTFAGKTTHNGGIKSTDIETASFLATRSAKIYGELRLQNGSNANGNYLYFGDESFCYLHEENDDRLTIYAQKGLVTKAATGTAWDSITKENWIDDNSAHTRFVNNYNALAIIIDKDYGASYRRAAIQVGDTSNNVGTLYLNPKGGEVHVGSTLYVSTINAGSTLYLQASTITNKAGWWTLSATGDFYTLGNIAAEGEISANALNQGSDIRFKHQLGDIALDLDTIANAPMFRFTWTNKENSRVQIGTSAQYWKDSARELVSVDKDDFHRLDYATLGVLIGVTLGKTVKNHENRIKELEREVVELKEENRRLRYEC